MPKRCYIRPTLNNKTAYKIAKGTTVARRFNPETKRVEQVEVPMPFSGWEDDIVEPVVEESVEETV